MRKVLLVGLFLIGLILSAQSTIYIATDNGTIYEVDPVNCTSTSLGTINVTGAILSGFSFYDIAINPLTEEMYGVDDVGNLVLIDYENGTGTVIGSNSPPTLNGLGLNALTFDENGVLYAAAGINDFLYTIDLTTGFSDAVGSMGTGLTSSGDLTFFEGQLYLTTSSQNFGQNSLILVHPVNPASSQVIGDFNGLTNIFGITSAIALDNCSSTLFAFQVNNIYFADANNLLNTTLQCSGIVPGSIYGAASVTETLEEINCDDNDCNTDDSFDVATCECEHTPIVIPDCNDNDCSTEDVYVPADCSCLNTLILDPGCDDGDTCNGLETWDGCDCQPGIPDVCANAVMVSCDDLNPCTISDSMRVDVCDASLECIPCVGTLIDCSNGSTSIQACDDGNALTENDMETVLDCNGTVCIPCEGTPLDCATGTIVPQDCDDGDPCTVGDEEMVILGQDIVCEPCAGILVTCDAGATIAQTCDDGNAETVEDIEYVLACDSSICVPCVGIVPEVINELYYPSAFSPNGDGVNETFVVRSTQEIAEFELQIFNRWGELVFSSTDIDFSWNGTTLTGDQAPLGVYVFQLRASFENGAEWPWKGDNVTLVR